MLKNKNFYPTPKKLIGQMYAKIKGNPKRVLEPSAGKGDIVEYLQDKSSYYSHQEIFCIESDPDLQATLRGKEMKLIDTDFLTYSAPDQFDLIIANPPFDNGEKHLLKMIDVMYSGQIICLLNAETIDNPHSLNRKLLVQKLDELGAEIEYQDGAFQDAERITNVRIAMINIIIEREIEDDLFDGCNDVAEEIDVDAKENHELSTGQTLEELVAEYNQVLRECTEMILTYARMYRKVKGYIYLTTESNGSTLVHGTLTEYVQEKVNDVARRLRKDYWRRLLKLEEVYKRMTEKKMSEFEAALDKQSIMDFTESNIRQFIINLIGSYEDTLTDAVIEIFDKMTIKYAWDEDLHNGNVHYFNGWKTNDAFKVNHRVVMPVYASYGKAFIGYNGQWEMDYKVRRQLDDIDIVAHYFDGTPGYLKMSEALEIAFRDNRSVAEGTYFKVRAFKKGTVHITFKDKDLLRRFNLAACRGKGWLPQDYGSKPFDMLTMEEKEVVTNFEENVTDYHNNQGQPLFAEAS